MPQEPCLRYIKRSSTETIDKKSGLPSLSCWLLRSFGLAIQLIGAIQSGTDISVASQKSFLCPLRFPCLRPPSAQMHYSDSPAWICAKGCHYSSCVVCTPQVVTLQVIPFKEGNLACHCWAWCEPCASITVHTEFQNV